MESNYIALMELVIVTAFIVGWGVLEIVGLRLDRKRESEKAKEQEKSDKANGV